jgi:hypothetical protein
MAGNRDYIPRSDADFNNWFMNLVEYVVEKTSGSPPAWDHIPQRHIVELVAAYEDWRRFYDPTLVPHIPAAITAKNDARRRAERVIRPFVRRFLHFEPVTNADRTNMAVPQHDEVRTDHTVVPEEVEFNIVIEGIRVVHIHFKVLGAVGHAKPEGYDGAVIVWDVLDAPPADVSALTRHTMASRTPHTLEFPEEERSGTVYVSTAWQNERGILGRWSEIKSAVIP